jgi:amidase
LILVGIVHQFTINVLYYLPNDIHVVLRHQSGMGMDNGHVVRWNQYVPLIGAALSPVLVIDPGSLVRFEIGDDAFERFANRETFHVVNPNDLKRVAGPVYVRGAEPGDALRIDILDIEIARAWSVRTPRLRGFHASAGEGNDEKVEVRQIPLHDGMARISAALSIPLQPSIGTIGVAPGSGDNSSHSSASFWGGNLDLRELSPGATLYLPVQEHGGLLYAGNLHASIGTTEPTGTSLEAAGCATLCVGLEKGLKLRFPRLRVWGSTICIGTGDTLQAARQAALDTAYDLLITNYGLQPFEADTYTSACVGMRFGGPASPIVLAVVPDPAA